MRSPLYVACDRAWLELQIYLQKSRFISEQRECDPELDEALTPKELDLKKDANDYVALEKAHNLKYAVALKMPLLGNAQLHRKAERALHDMIRGLQRRLFKPELEQPLNADEMHFLIAVQIREMLLRCLNEVNNTKLNLNNITLTLDNFNKALREDYQIEQESCKQLNELLNKCTDYIRTQIPATDPDDSRDSSLRSSSSWPSPSSSPLSTLANSLAGWLSRSPSPNTTPGSTPPRAHRLGFSRDDD